MTEEKKDPREKQGFEHETMTEEEIQRAERAAGESGPATPEEYWKDIQTEVSRSHEQAEGGVKRVVSGGGDPEDVAVAQEAGDVLMRETNTAAAEEFKTISAAAGKEKKVAELIQEQDGLAGFRNPADAELFRKNNPSWREDTMPDGSVMFSSPEYYTITPGGTDAEKREALKREYMAAKNGIFSNMHEEAIVEMQAAGKEYVPPVASTEAPKEARVRTEGFSGPKDSPEKTEKPDILNIPFMEKEEHEAVHPETDYELIQPAGEIVRKETIREVSSAVSSDAKADVFDSSLGEEIPGHAAAEETVSSKTNVTPEEVLNDAGTTEGGQPLTKERIGELRAWLKDFRGVREGILQKQKEIEKLGTVGGFLKKKEKERLQAEAAALEQEYKTKRAEYVGEKAHRFLNEKARLAESQAGQYQKEKGFGRKFYDAYKKMGEWNLGKVIGEKGMQKLEAKEDDSKTTRVAKGVAKFAMKVISVRTAVSGALLGAGLAFGAGAAAGIGAVAARRVLSGVGTGVGSYDLMTMKHELQQKGEDLRIWKFKISADKDKAKLRDLKKEEAAALSSEEILTRLDHFDIAGQMNGINPRENSTYKLLQREFNARSLAGKVGETLEELQKKDDEKLAEVKGDEQTKKTRRKIIAGVVGAVVGSGALAKAVGNIGAVKEHVAGVGGGKVETLHSVAHSESAAGAIPGNHSEAPVMAFEDHSEAPVGRMTGDDSFTGKIEKGGSVWKATKDLLKQKADDLGTNEIAYNEAVRTGHTKLPTYDAWLNQKTQELVDDLGRMQGGDVRDLIHSGDSIIVKQGINGTLSLDFEETSGIDSDYLPYDPDGAAKVPHEYPEGIKKIIERDTAELEELKRTAKYPEEIKRIIEKDTVELEELKRSASEPSSPEDLVDPVRTLTSAEEEAMLGGSDGAIPQKEELINPVRTLTPAEEELLQKQRLEMPAQPDAAGELEKAVGGGEHKKWVLSDEYTGGKKHEIHEEGVDAVIATEESPAVKTEYFEGKFSGEIVQRAQSKSIELSDQIRFGQIDTAERFLKEMRGIKGSDLTDMEKKTLGKAFEKMKDMKNGYLLKTTLQPRILKLMAEQAAEK